VSAVSRNKFSPFGLLAFVGGLVVALFEWLVISHCPDLGFRWRWSGRLISASARLAGISVTVEGELDTRLPCVFVANHASFLDSVVLVACFPTPVCFVAAQEFRGKPLLGQVLKRLGVEFVHRDDAMKAAGDSRRLLSRLKRGERLFIFPE
jgi:1-acyl-sn-glycerol-3-phosphate acyltransferase